jgi:hypothetical protein
VNALYTILCNYRGGTYIGQARAAKPAMALQRWVTSAIGKGVIPIPADKRSAVGEALVRESLVHVRDCANVWCTTALCSSDLILVNIVRTHESTE